MRRLQLVQGNKGLELRGKGLVVEEGSPKFDELLSRDGKDFIIEEVMPETRMAGDVDITDLLESLKGDVALEKALADAEVYIDNRAPDLRKLVNAKEAKTLAQAEDQLLALGELQGGVPMPIIKSLKDGERRKHTQYSVNDVTGQREVIPVMDPSNPKQVLQTTFGRMGIDTTAGHQSEPVMLNAYKLAGNDVQYHDPEGMGKADLRVTNSDGSRNIDVMFQDQSRDYALPLYTSLVPVKGGYDNTRGDTRGNKEEVERLINQRLAKQGNKDYIAAVESLVKADLIGLQDKEKRAGKILRGSPSVFPRTSDQFYHGLILPEYSAGRAKLSGDSAQKNVPQPPDAIMEVPSLEVALDALMSGKAGKVKTVTNRGYLGNSYERLQVKPVFEPEDIGMVDMTAVHPLTQQLLSHRQLRERTV